MALCTIAMWFVCCLVLIACMGLLREWRTTKFRCLTLVASDVQLCQPGEKRE
ncbi:hypothetical protein GXU05_002702 [Escherichia coli]|nr:hypothetical protein [Escherichia coli]EFI4235296.1 hypothetical protein [Escherichia coli]EFI4389480.1 hypothetical protein [Escherichia coli]EFJ0060533.1 hypothetical protein [Escherichia coli]HAH5597595.1 hypothetical protein [Escherichia coli]